MGVQQSGHMALASELATVTADWLAEKASWQSDGSQDLLTESLLIIPIVEYFKISSKKWELKGEWHDGTSLVNIDLRAKHLGETIFIELKYLKKASDQRLIKDLVKLASLKDIGSVRLLLIAHSPNGHMKNQSNSRLVQAIAASGRQVAFSVTRSDALVAIKSDLNAIHTLTGEQATGVVKILNNDASLDFTVKLAASCSHARENVYVFLISRV